MFMVDDAGRSQINNVGATIIISILVPQIFKFCV